MSIMLLSSFEYTFGKVHAMGEFLQAQQQLESHKERISSAIYKKIKVRYRSHFSGHSRAIDEWRPE